MSAADELDGTVTVRVAGDDVVVPRPPFRRLQPLLSLPEMAALLSLEANEGEDTVGGEVAIAALIPMGEALAAVLFDDPDAHLDRIFSPSEWAEFIGSAIDALQLGEVLASAGS